MQTPMDLVQHFSDQMNWVKEMFGPDGMSQMRDIMKSIKDPGDRPRSSAPPPAGSSNAGPPLELYLTPDTLVLCVVLPGLASPEHLQISLTGPKELLIEAFLAPQAMHGSLLQQERFTGYCHRIITLPAAILPEGGTAAYSDGILECRFPRLEKDGTNTGVAVLQVQQP